MKIWHVCGLALFAPDYVAFQVVILRRAGSTPVNPDPRAPTHTSKIASAKTKIPNPHWKVIEID